LNSGHFSCFTFILCFVGESRCLSHGVQVVGAAWCAAMRIVIGVGDLVQRTGDGRTGQVPIGRAIERSGGAVCDLHRARGDEKHMFLGCASKPKSMVCEWFGLKTSHTVFSSLASKPVAMVFSGLASKPVGRVSRFGPQSWQLRFGDLGLKITAMVSWFGSQNQPGFGLSVAPQNQQREDGAGHMSRSGGLLHVEASRARVSQSSLKIGEGAMAGGVRGTIVKVASGSSGRRTGRCDRLRRTLLPLLCCF
jgi:hypothetical protein